MTTKRISVLLVLVGLVAGIAFVGQGGYGLASWLEAQLHGGATPVAALGQHLVARTYVEIDPETGQPLDRGSAALFAPYLTGIPEPLFSERPWDEKTAYFTAVFSPFHIDNVIQNGSMIHTFFTANHEVQFYFDANPNQDFNDFDTFRDGEHVATFTTVRNMANQAGTIATFVNSAKLTWSKDFTYIDGKTYNFKDLVPGGITVHVLTNFVPIVDDQGSPVVVPLTQVLDDEGNPVPAIMFPFSGTGIHQAPQLSDVTAPGLSNKR